MLKRSVTMETAPPGEIYRKVQVEGVHYRPTFVKQDHEVLWLRSNDTSPCLEPAWSGVLFTPSTCLHMATNPHKCSGLRR